MNKSVRRGAGLSVIGLCLMSAVNTSYAQDACLGARVTAFDAGVFQSFGYSVAVSGETALIGAQWDNDLGTQSGSVYVYQFDPSLPELWVFAQKLLASDGQGGDDFGRRIAMDGEVALIGALHLHDEGGDVAYGAAYVFRHDGARWVEEQELLASDSAFQDGFGAYVSLSGDVIVIGASGDDDNGFGSGSAYVFRYDPKSSQWIEEQKLTASDAAAGDSFGRVSVSGDVVVIGAGGDDSACPKDPSCDSGAAYVFRYDAEASLWVEQQKLLASDGAYDDGLGKVVAVSGDTALIGAPFDEDNGIDSGSAYVFRFDPNTSTWIEEHKILASDGQGDDQFGRAVAIDGEWAVIGAWLHDDMGSSSGAAYVFGFDAESSTWIEQHKLLPQANAWTQFFGYSVAIDGDKAIAGAHGEDQQRGAAYAFDVALNCNCPHDLDADGNVGVTDLLALLASWGPCKDCPADFDENDNVGVSDLLTLLANWGPCP